MSEVHRYQVVTMLSVAGATIGYDPHGPDVVMAAEFDRVTAERDALQQRLTAADERADVLGKALRKISRAHDCGCLPCRGDCTSKLSLEIALDEIRESAASALMLSQTVAMNDVLIVGAAPMIGVTRFKP